MRVLKMRNYLCSALLLTAFIWLSAGTALGLTVNMVAEEASVTMPDLTTVPMWGLRDTADAAHAAGDWKVPVIKTNESVLTINLTNNLPDDTASTLKKPTSLIIPGLLATEPFAMVPTWTNGDTGSRMNATQRVRSLTHEANSGGGSDSYSWNLKPGTYLIQSGSHQAVQVQMGLFAVLVVYPAGTTNQAYDADSTFTAEQVLVYSEIDTALHAAIALDDYGPGQSYSSTMDFNPDYYLVNGQPYSAGTATSIVGGSVGNVLLRFVNAGYETRVPVMQGDYFSLISEDGNLLPYPQEVYSVELTAGKTRDALWSDPQPGITNLYDARFNLTNAGTGGGGLLAKLAIGEEGALLVPNGGESWTRGGTYTVRWVLNPAADDYRVVYFDADGTIHRLGSLGNVDSFNWTIPFDAVAESGKSMRVAAFSGATLLGADLSDETFTIQSQMFPNGGETLTEGLTYQLAWGVVPGADSYRLRYFDADNTIRVIANVGNVTGYTWTIPFDVSAESGKRYRVTAFSGGTLIPGTVQWSDAPFTIASQLYPNGGEILTSGQTYQLTWASIPGADRYRLFYFDSNNTPHAIGVVVNGTSYNWTVPLDAVNESGKRFRVTAFNGATNLSVVQWSDGTFTIAP